MYFMSNILLNDKIYGVHVTQLQLAEIWDTTHPLHKKWLSCVVKYLLCGGKINN